MYLTKGMRTRLLRGNHHYRINVGGLHTVCYLHRLLQLKYPGLQTHVTLSRAQELVNHHSYIALDYAAELKDWAAGRHEKDFRLIQLPYTQVRRLSYVVSPGYGCSFFLVLDDLCLLSRRWQALL